MRLQYIVHLKLKQLLCKNNCSTDLTLGAEKLKSQSCKKVCGITNLYFQIDFQFLGFFLEGEGGYLFNSLWTEKKIMT